MSVDRQAFLREARKLVEDRSKFIVLEHARTRDLRAGKFPISDVAMVNCVKAANAVVTEGPAPDLKQPGGWKARITTREPGKTTDLACVIVPERLLMIITAYEVRQFTRARRLPAGSADTGDEQDSDNGQV